MGLHSLLKHQSTGCFTCLKITLQTATVNVWKTFIVNIVSVLERCSFEKIPVLTMKAKSNIQIVSLLQKKGYLKL